MPTEKCPRCGRPVSQESRDCCQCEGRPIQRSGRGLDGRFFVRTILLIAVILAILSIGLFYGIAHLRTLYGLSGFHH